MTGGGGRTPALGYGKEASAGALRVVGGLLSVPRRTKLRGRVLDIDSWLSGQGSAGDHCAT